MLPKSFGIFFTPPSNFVYFTLYQIFEMQNQSFHQTKIWMERNCEMTEIFLAYTPNYILYL
jgi:hypothetical protein